MSEFKEHDNGRAVGIFVAWPYANGPRHVGHSAALMPADVAARYFRAVGADVLVASGTDEFGTPNMIAAEKKGLETKQFVDEMSAVIRKDFVGLGLTYDWFTRTTSPNHREVVQKFFSQLTDDGFISKGEMLASYDSETGEALADRYVEGVCPICDAEGARGDQCDNCSSLLEPSDLMKPYSSLTGNLVKFKPTTHYFLNLDKLKGEVAEFLKSNKNLRKEAQNMSANLVEGLRPRAITRDIPWGVPLPAGYEMGEGENRVLYVWFDAVIGYLSASIEWAHEQGDDSLWKRFWIRGGVENYYFMGKDNVPFHTIIWPALLAAKNKRPDELGIELAYPGRIASTGNLNFNGDKFSTSRGNVAYVSDMLDIVGPDALRYYLIVAGPENRDSNFALDELVTKNNSELVAKWGNLVSRTTNLIQRDCDGVVPEKIHQNPEDDALLERVAETFGVVGELIEVSRFSQALKAAMDTITAANRYVDSQKPWDKEVVASGRNIEVLATLAVCIENMTKIMTPFMPHSSQRISEAFGSTDRIAPLPETSTSGRGVEVITTPNPAGDLIWTYANEWAGNKLATGKSIIFTKLDEKVVQEQFEATKK